MSTSSEGSYNDFRSTEVLGRGNSSEGINGMLPKDANIQQEMEEAIHEVTNYRYDNMDEEDIRKVVTTAALVLIPIFYLYTWLCARSLYLQLSFGEVEPSPGQRRPPGWALGSPGSSFFPSVFIQGVPNPNLQTCQNSSAY